MSFRRNLVKCATHLIFQKLFSARIIKNQRHLRSDANPILSLIQSCLPLVFLCGEKKAHVLFRFLTRPLGSYGDDSVLMTSLMTTAHLSFRVLNKASVLAIKIMTPCHSKESSTERSYTCTTHFPLLHSRFLPR